MKRKVQRKKTIRKKKKSIKRGQKGGFFKFLTERAQTKEEVTESARNLAETIKTIVGEENLRKFGKALSAGYK